VTAPLRLGLLLAAGSCADDNAGRAAQTADRPRQRRRHALDKFAGLAKVWPASTTAPGQASGQPATFNLIVMENKMLAALLTGAAPPARGTPITEPAQMQEALGSSYGAVKTALAGLSDSDLSTKVKIFGMDSTKQGAAMMLLSDQHEHLGQSIAYARSNGVVPPWSK
jgi:hypothetical protein